MRVRTWPFYCPALSPLPLSEHQLTMWYHNFSEAAYTVDQLEVSNTVDNNYMSLMVSFDSKDRSVQKEIAARK